MKSMSLTAQDLQAIKGIVDVSVDTALEDLKIMIALGFNDVYTKQDMDLRFDEIDQRFTQMDQRFNGVDERLDGIDDRLDQIQHIQMAEVTRNDRQGQDIAMLKRRRKLA